ncbi:hypothetical protein FKM82_003067 [Ascaphus truei]
MKYYSSQCQLTGDRNVFIKGFSTPVLKTPPPPTGQVLRISQLQHRLSRRLISSKPDLLGVSRTGVEQHYLNQYGGFVNPDDRTPQMAFLLFYLLIIIICFCYIALAVDLLASHG